MTPFRDGILSNAALNSALNSEDVSALVSATQRHLPSFIMILVNGRGHG